MAVYPLQLTAEEKSLKKRYARLFEKRKLLRKQQEKPATLLLKSAAAKPTNAETLCPKDAKAAAKRLLEAGKLKLTKKGLNKRTGFKRVGEASGETPPSKKPNINTHGEMSTVTEQQQTLVKKKIKADQIKMQKALYSNFVKPSTGSMERIPKKQEDEETLSTQSDSTAAEKTASTKECTIFVSYQYSTLTEEALNKAFSRFGVVQKTEIKSKNSAFLTFTRPGSARTAIKEMNRGMIRGNEVYVDPAGEENNYIELPEDANEWARIAAGKEITGSPVKKKGKDKKLPSYNDMEF